jgi:hypothetical protein
MSIDVERMESWIGGDVFADSGDKLGTIEDVYFVGTEPMAVGVRSGLAGRKHHVATLKGAGVSFDGVRLAVSGDHLVETDGGPLTATQISALSGHDERLAALAPEQVEGWHQREVRLKEADEAQSKAAALDDEVRQRAQDEAQAVSEAHEAQGTAQERIHERQEAETRAAAAHAAANQIEQS